MGEVKRYDSAEVVHHALSWDGEWVMHSDYAALEAKLAASEAACAARDAAGPLRPSPSLLCKIGSSVVHFNELQSRDGHAFDKHALDSLLADTEVCEWIASMQRLSLLPLMRAAPPKENAR